MSEARVIKADFVDTRRVKTRNVLQLIFECALEQEPEVMARLGWPTPATALPVAIARLAPDTAGAQRSAPESAPQPVPIRPVRNWRDIPRSQQAALSLQNDDFANWLLEPTLLAWGTVEERTVLANQLLKDKLGISSKKELDTNEYKAAEWDKLRTSFSVKDYGLK